MKKNRTAISRWTMAGSVVLASLGIAASASLGAEDPPADAPPTPPDTTPGLGWDEQIDIVGADDPNSDIYVPIWRPPSLHTVQEDRVYDPPNDGRDGGNSGWGGSGGNAISAGGSDGFGLTDSTWFDPMLPEQRDGRPLPVVDWRDAAGGSPDDSTGFSFELPTSAAEFELYGSGGAVGPAANAIPAPGGLLTLVGAAGLAASRRRRR